MLTNSQTWRRANTRYSKNKLKRTEEYLQYCLNSYKNTNNVFITENVSNIKSVKRIKPEIEIEENFVNRLEENNNLSSSRISNKVKKLSFDSQVRVYLIPDRNDFIALFSEMFWQRKDYSNFKEDAHKELEVYWKTNKSSVKEAIKALYQPTSIITNHEIHKIERHNSTKSPSKMIKKSLINHNDSVNNLVDMMELSYESDNSLNNNESKYFDLDISNQNNIHTINSNHSFDINNNIEYNKRSVKGLLAHNDSIGNLTQIISNHESPNDIQITISIEKSNTKDFISKNISFNNKLLLHSDSINHLSDSSINNELVAMNNLNIHLTNNINEDIDYPGLEI